MTSQSNDRCGQTERLFEYALGALSAAKAVGYEAHLAVCAPCRHEADSLLEVVAAFAAWPTDVLRPPKAAWDRLSERIGASEQDVPAQTGRWHEPLWEEIAPGISCKLLASDSTRDQVAMLVRLAPGIAYPSHTHSGIEELHLLAGELWMDDKRLYPGEYNRAERGTSDRRVWSETGCTCVLITALSDVLD